MGIYIASVMDIHYILGSMKGGKHNIMICTCEECRYTFKRVGSYKYCPDCGSDRIRQATPREKKEYIDYQKEFYPKQQLA